MPDFNDKNATNSISAGPLPQTPLGEFTALPIPLAGFKEACFKGGEGRESGDWGWEQWEGERWGREE